MMMLTDELLKLSEKAPKATPSRNGHSRRPAPEPEVMKISTDGDFIVESRNGGGGFIIRDRSGEAVHAGAGNTRHLRDAFHAEVMSSLAGIRAAS